MGINGLLPKLASVTEAVTLEALANLCVAVDAYVWLHKASYSCARELVQGVPTDRFVHYCMNLVRMLQHYKIHPVLVFDGAPLPTKLGTEQERRQKRDANKQQAMQYLAQGNSAAAEECFQRAVSITPRMAHQFVKALKQAGVEYIVAPYEADAQLAYLSISGYVDAVITEDSDLLAYGATRVIFKLDKYGNGKQIRQERLCTASELDLTTFTQANFRHMCILSGCDYVSNVAGIGMARAHKLVHKFRDPAKIFKALRLDANVDFPPNYPEHFRRADLTFQHQCVFDPITRKLVPLHPFPPHVEPTSVHFVGPFYDEAMAVRVCTGEVDPVTHEPFEEAALVFSTEGFKAAARGATPSAKTLVDTVRSHSLTKYFERSRSEGAMSTPAERDKSLTRNHSVIAPDTPPQHRSSVKRVLVRSKFWNDAHASAAHTYERGSAMLIRTKSQAAYRTPDVVVRQLNADFETSERLLDDLLPSSSSSPRSPRRQKERFIPAPPSVVEKTFVSPLVKRGRLTLRAHVDLTETPDAEDVEEKDNGNEECMDVDEGKGCEEDCAENCENHTPSPDGADKGSERVMQHDEDDCAHKDNESSDVDLEWTSRLFSLTRSKSTTRLNATVTAACASPVHSPVRSWREMCHIELSDDEEIVPLSPKHTPRLLDRFLVPNSPNEKEMRGTAKKRARTRSSSPPPAKFARTLPSDSEEAEAALELTRSVAQELDEESPRPLLLLSRFAFQRSSSGSAS